MQPSSASCAFSSASSRVWPHVWQPGNAGTDASQFPSSSLLNTTAYLTGVLSQASWLNSSSLTPASLRIFESVPIGSICRPWTGTESVTLVYTALRMMWWLPRTRSTRQPILSSIRTSCLPVTLFSFSATALTRTAPPESGRGRRARRGGCRPLSGRWPPAHRRSPPPAGRAAAGHAAGRSGR